MGSTKVEPKVTGINPGKVSRIGIQEIKTRSEPQPRGFMAPALKGQTNHKCGSQGKH